MHKGSQYQSISNRIISRSLLLIRAFLLFRVRSPILRCLVVAADAPHTGSQESDIANWWDRLQRHMPVKYRQWYRIFLADANPRIGAYPASSIGTWQAEIDSEKSEPFIQLVEQNNLWIPATFEESRSWIYMASHLGLDVFPFAVLCQ